MPAKGGKNLWGEYWLAVMVKKTAAEIRGLSPFARKKAKDGAPQLVVSQGVGHPPHPGSAEMD